MKILNKIIGAFLGVAMALGIGFVVSGTSKAIPVHAAETTHTFTDIAFSKLLNNSATIDSVSIPQQSYSVSKIVANVRYNKTVGGVTITPTIGTTVLESQTHNANSTVDLTWSVSPAVQGVINFDFINNCGSGTGKGTFYFNSVTLTEEGGTVEPFTPKHAGTLLDPYTVTDARGLIDDNQMLENVYVTGIVHKVNAYDTTYNNINFFFSDDGSALNDLEAYRCAGTEAESVEVGDTVVVYGSLTKYNSTYELASGCELITLIKPVSPEYIDTYGLAGYNIIYENHDGTNYYMNIDSASSSVKPTAVTSEADASVFLFTLVADDTFTITNEAKTTYLYSGSGNTNKVLWGSTQHAWSVDNNAAGELVGTYNLIDTTANKCMCIYNNTDWATYTSTTATNRKYKTEIALAPNAEGFASAFLSKIGCDADGINAPTFASGYTWSNFKTMYTNLISTEQAKLQNTTGQAQIIINAMARYDYIVGKYGVATYEDFIGRNPAPIGNSRAILNTVIGTSTNAAIIAVISLISITAIGAYVFIRKKKEN